MTDVKAVIALLCKHLKLSFDVNIRPEHFRLSKFDKTEDNSICQMWEILYKICKELPQQSVEDDVVTTVKLRLAMLGYRCVDFYCLPPDMSHGSRELLLALGWLLATQNVLENSVMKALRVSQLNMEFDNIKQVDVEPPLLVHKSGSLETMLNSILWIAGNIRRNINMITELDQARISHAVKIHQGSVNASNLPHLSVSETNLVQNPELLPAYLKQVNAKATLIETHKQWGKKSHIFWEWMESVVAEKESKADMSHLSVEEKRTLFAVLDALRGRIKSLILKYQRLLSDNVVSEDIEYLSQTIQGMPRCIRQPKEKDTEMARLLLDSEKQLEYMQKVYEQKEVAVKLQLHELAKRMEQTVVLFPQELK